MRISLRFAALAAIAAATSLTLAACGSSGSSSSGDSSAAASGCTGGSGKVTVGSANFSESELIADMYAEALKACGFDVTVKPNIGSREVYLKALESGEVDVVPEYAATVTEYYNAQINGKDAPTAKPLATTDPATTLAALKTLIASKNLVASATSPADDVNAFAVTKDYATKNNLTKLSDLTKLNGQLILGGPAECPTRPFCQAGLEKSYGLQFKSFKATDAGGPVTIGALKDGTINLGLVFSSDGSVAANNLLVLQDDKKLQLADNILALSRKTVPALALTQIDKVNAALTTTDLQGLNKKISVDKDEPAALAKQWAKDKKLA